MGMRVRMQNRLEDSRLLLEPADVLDDVADVIGRHFFNLRHVAEFPMMRLDTVGGSPLERGVSVVIGLVDLVNERRALLGPDTADSMTRRTVGNELLFPDSEFSRYGLRGALRLALALTARRSSSQRKHKYTHPHRL